MPKVKRLSKIIHPNSRRALELASKEHHKTRTIRSKIETKNRSNILSRKLLWFRNQISDKQIEIENDDETMDLNDGQVQNFNSINKTNSFFTVSEIHQLIDLYFHRFDHELEQINTKNSIGKRHIGQNFSREKAIEITLNAEKNEYETAGIVVPDLCNVDNVKLLRAWNGQSSLLPAIKLKTIKKL